MGGGISEKKTDVNFSINVFLSTFYFRSLIMVHMMAAILMRELHKSTKNLVQLRHNILTVLFHYGKRLVVNDKGNEKFPRNVISAQSSSPKGLLILCYCF